MLLVIHVLPDFLLEQQSVNAPSALPPKLSWLTQCEIVNGLKLKRVVCHCPSFTTRKG